MSLQSVQLRCRSAARWPTDARLDAVAGGASKPRKAHSRFAKQRPGAVSPPLLQVAFSAAGRPARPLRPMAVGLPGNDRSLNARQKLLRFEQGQSQVRNIAKTFRPADLYQIGAQTTGIIPRRNQPQHPSHPRSPGRLSTRPIVPPVSSCPHSLDTPLLNPSSHCQPWHRPNPQNIIGRRFHQRRGIVSGLAQPRRPVARFQGHRHPVVKFGHGRIGVGGAVEARNCDRSRSDVHAIAIWPAQSLCPSTSLLGNHHVDHLARG